jgi:hypothetical protein
MSLALSIITVYVRAVEMSLELYCSGFLQAGYGYERRLAVLQNYGMVLNNH